MFLTKENDNLVWNFVDCSIVVCPERPVCAAGQRLILGICQPGTCCPQYGCVTGKSIHIDIQSENVFRLVNEVFPDECFTGVTGKHIPPRTTKRGLCFAIQKLYPKHTPGTVWL